MVCAQLAGTLLRYHFPGTLASVAPIYSLSASLLTRRSLVSATKMPKHRWPASVARHSRAGPPSQSTGSSFTLPSAAPLPVELLLSTPNNQGLPLASILSIHCPDICHPRGASLSSTGRQRLRELTSHLVQLQAINQPSAASQQLFLGNRSSNCDRTEAMPATYGSGLLCLLGIASRRSPESAQCP